VAQGLENRTQYTIRWSVAILNLPERFFTLIAPTISILVLPQIVEVSATLHSEIAAIATVTALQDGYMDDNTMPIQHNRDGGCCGSTECAIQTVNDGQCP